MPINFQKENHIAKLLHTFAHPINQPRKMWKRNVENDNVFQTIGSSFERNYNAL